MCMNFYPPPKSYFLKNLFNLPEYKDSFINIKFDYCKSNEKAHLRSDFRKQYFGGWGLNWEPLEPTEVLLW